MKGIAKLAIKNLSRYRRRTIITAYAVAMGLFFFIFLDSLLVGIFLDSEINLQRYETGSGKILNNEYWEDYEMLPLDLVVENQILQKIKDSGFDYTPLVRANGEMIISEDDFSINGSLPIQYLLVDPETVDDVFYFGESLYEGEFLTSGSNGAVIGKWFAEDINADIGDTFEILSKNRNGGDSLIELIIVGIMDCSDPLANRNGLLIDYDYAEYILQMDGEYTEIAVKVLDEKKWTELDTICEGSNSSFYNWEELSASFLALAASKTGSSYVMLFLVLIIAAVGISNTMLMAIFERTKELGMMRAMGMRDSEIRKMFLLEAAGIGVMGSVIGTIIGVALNFFLVEKGINISFIMRQMDVGYRVAGIMYGAWRPGSIIITLLTGGVFCALIALLSTRKLNKMTITDCLRYN